MTEQNKKPFCPLIAVVDLESLDTVVSAVIASVGCVVIDVLTGEEKGSFYHQLDVTEQEGIRSHSQDTLDWWQKIREQNPEAYLATFPDKTVFSQGNDYGLLPYTLNAFNEFLRAQFGDERIQIMGNGSEFDNAILMHAMHQFGIEPAWDHGGNQSLRTPVWMGRLLLDYDPKYELEFEGIKHHALHDARHEAKYLHLIVKMFQEKLGLTEEKLRHAFTQGFDSGYNQEECLIHPEQEALELANSFLTTNA